jgi:hypothetical protein
LVAGLLFVPPVVKTGLGDGRSARCNVLNDAALAAVDYSIFANGFKF